MPTAQTSTIEGRALQPLYGARSLAEWVRAGGNPERSAPLHTLRRWWHALWFEQNWRTQSARLSSLPAPADPVFILGLWRSGTTALHELLAASTEWTTPQTWQCFSPSTCFLTTAPVEQSLTERPMDHGYIATHGPQEDEFALLLLGEPSVYRGFLDPRRLRECGREHWPGDSAADQAAELGAASLPRWQGFVRGIAAQRSQSRLLLKSPNHTFRVPLLRSLYPQARFIWIGRHTGEVLASNFKMWRAMMGLYALWPCPGGMLEGFLQDVLQACCAVLTRCLEEIPPEQLLWVQFEELRADARRTLERVLDFLGPFPDVESAQRRGKLEQALARIPVHPGARSDMPDTPAVHQLERLLRAAQQRFGAGGAVARRTFAR